MGRIATTQETETLIARMDSRECDGCHARGIVCATTDGEIHTGEGLVDISEGLTSLSLAILLPGKADGSDAHHTYCDECA